MDSSETSCFAICPSCEAEEEHEIVRKREVGSGLDVKVQCNKCSLVHKIHIRPNKGMELAFLLSEGPTSSNAKIEVDDDEMFRVGDIFEHDEKLWRINTIESTQNKFMRKSLPNRIGRITAIRFDEVRVKVTMTDGDISTPGLIICEPDRVFAAGSIIEYEGMKWRIRSINTSKGSTLRGKFDAYKIKRLYLQPPPPPKKAPRTSRERRQAWKEGKLGFNPNPEKK
ncbi:MAG: hypothetical protein CMB48_02510 [Euryarchaeota archaeon]|nr:hypothetical protein [Euryarchaeota archaeon]|tara:strand:- start:906 stop:1583 length:678 start_codon:yes stop_codon:yes gene_type:complete